MESGAEFLVASAEQLRRRMGKPGKVTEVI
jgi:hypothetical protein